MSAAGTAVKVHVLIGLALLPFTRLVHAFSAPIGYLIRPYIVYRTRDTTEDQSRRPIHRGW